MNEAAAGTQEPRWFPSAVDWWIGAVLIFAAGATLFSLAAGITAGDAWAGIAGTVIVGLVFGGLVLPMR